MDEQQTSLKLLLTGYISAFVIVIALATLSQAIVQYALNQEVISRQASTSVSNRIVYSQRMQRNTVLLIGTEDRRASDAELARDLAAIQASATDFVRDYPDYASQVKAALPADAAVQYQNVIHAGTVLVQMERQYAHAPYKVRLKAEGPYISLMFYSEIKQLGYLQRVQQIVDSASDAYIAHIRAIEIILYGLNLVVWGVELFLVLIPTSRRFTADMRELRAAAPIQVQAF